MHVYERTQKSVAEYASEVSQRGRGLFQSQELRNKVCAKLISDGQSVTKRSTRGQQLHPEYVTDYVGTIESGFGNSQYQTYWSVLYEVNVR